MFSVESLAQWRGDSLERVGGEWRRGRKRSGRGFLRGFIAHGLHT